jgi:hypothetical protein
MQAFASIETTNARRYLGQFCKHFAHKLPVDLAETNESGTVTFTAGTCTLNASETTLDLTLTATTQTETATLQDVVNRHLTRFAFREPVTITWQPRVAAALSK